MIYVFRKYESSARIIVYAESYLEAKDALFALHPWADKEYNIAEYKMYRIDYNKFFDILNIENDMRDYPRILSESELSLLVKNKVLVDTEFNTLHNTHVLAKKDFNEDTRYPAYSTSEYVKMLSDNVLIKDTYSKSIKKMMSIVGDVWFMQYSPLQHGPENNYIYGLSRQQCIDLYKEIYKFRFKGADECNPFTIPEPKLLINSATSISDIIKGNFKNEDIDNYKKMVSIMKELNIKKFPFSAYEEFARKTYMHPNEIEKIKVD